MAGHVYLIGSRRFHWFKIGKSSRAAIRVSELGILLPFKVEVIAVWNAIDHTKLENELHKQYAACRINGEWFSFSNDQLNTLLHEMSMWTTKAIPTYSNMPSDVLIEHPMGREAQRRIKMILQENRELKQQVESMKKKFESADPSQPVVHVLGPGAQRRIDRLIKENHCLKQQIQALNSGATVQ